MTAAQVQTPAQPETQAQTAARPKPWRAPWFRRAAFYAFLLLAVGAPFLASAVGGNYWVRVLDFALLYIMLALGLNIVVGFAGLLDMGYIAFYAVGAYTMALLGSPHLSTHFSWIAQWFPHGLHTAVWGAIPVALGLAALFGVLLGAPTLRLRGDYLAIVTLGFGEIIRIFMNNLDRPVNITNGPQGINLIEPVRLFGIDFSKPHEWLGIRFTSIHLYYYLFVIMAALIIVVCLRLQHSRIGRAWVAIREDEIAAKAMGINTRNIKLLAFAMGASFGGVSGALFASFQGFVSPESFTFWESIYVLAIVVLGGIGHIPGVILGGLLLVGFQELLRAMAVPVQMALFHQVFIDAEVLRQLLFGLAMVAVMLYRPAGLWPAPRKEDRPQRVRAAGLARA